MQKIRNCELVSGGDQNGSNMYVPDPGAMLINVGVGMVGGALGGSVSGPPGMIVGAIGGATVAAISTMSIDAYNIHKSTDG